MSNDDRWPYDSTASQAANGLHWFACFNVGMSNVDGWPYDSAAGPVAIRRPLLAVERVMAFAIAD